MTTNVLKFSLPIAIVLVAVVFGVWYFVAPPKETPAMGGRIEGTTTYPSEYIPTQIVCAEPVGGGSEICVEVAGADPTVLTPSWGLDVPAGEYYVSSHMKDPSEMGSDFGEYRAYYTQYVLCGLEASCTDHTKAVVNVPSGEMVSDINPHDWYIR
jgi:hypothetical protein